MNNLLGILKNLRSPISLFTGELDSIKSESKQKVMSNNRAVLFAHFDKHNIIDDYVIYYLNELKKISRSIIFVSTSSISESELAKLQGICALVFTRPNIGYDFYSWKEGFAQLLDLDKYDELVICNDSCYGPVFDLHPIFEKMSLSKADFWGMTSNSQIQFHLQSYFLVFKRQVFLSKIFQDFWLDLKIVDSKPALIFAYEIGLTQKLIKANFKAGSFFKMSLFNAHIFCYSTVRNLVGYLYNCLIYCFFTNTKRYQLLSSTGFEIFRVNHLLHTNPTHRLGLTALKYGCPFVKVELLRDNPLHIRISDILHYLSRKSDYKVDYILRHLKRVRTYSK